MLTRLVFFVPGEPVAKERPRTVRVKKSGRTVTFTPRTTVNFEKLVRLHAMRAALIGQWPKPSKFARYFVSLVFHFGGESRKDLDNVAKAILDGLKHTAFLDDCQVAKLVLERVMCDVRPGVHVTVARMREVFYKRPPKPEEARA